MSILTLYCLKYLLSLVKPFLCFLNMFFFCCTYFLIVIMNFRVDFHVLKNSGQFVSYLIFTNGLNIITRLLIRFSVNLPFTYLPYSLNRYIYLLQTYVKR